MDEQSPLVQHLNQTNRDALVGIQRADGVYTVIGQEHVYYATPAGAAGAIAIADLLTILRKNALRLGKRAPFEFVEINETDCIWVMNSQVMNALWNTLLLLEPLK
ncbi:hypothetical protein [Hymenobacter swuensis]|uniref:hypothetical protein n=1 Tax=Hymenobacter swuensis TaxID=1446467 RepID=UPI0005C779DA|nr:hypothetical protein [Hymenobacter swuensis]